jgi:hypothetical protein
MTEKPRAKPVRLEMTEVIKLSRWMDENKQSLDGLTREAICKLAKAQLGREVALNTISTLANEAGITFKKQRKANTAPKFVQALPVLYRMCAELYGDDHEDTELLRSLLPSTKE